MAKKKTKTITKEERAYIRSLDSMEKEQAVRDAWFSQRADNLKQPALGWEYESFYWGHSNPYDDKKD